MSNIISMLNYEEGFKSKPYYCSEGYPTVATGVRIGPKGAPLSMYQFTVSKTVAAVWLAELVKETISDMDKYPNVKSAMSVCNDARQAVLISMAYQMGVDGLAEFKNTLKAVAEKRWQDAKNGMLGSKWARQTPYRASRQAEQMLTGNWQPEYKE